MTDINNDQYTFYWECRYFSDERGYKTTYAATIFKERFGEWPPEDFKKGKTIPPGPGTLIFLSRELEKYRKVMEIEKKGRWAFFPQRVSSQENSFDRKTPSRT